MLERLLVEAVYLCYALTAVVLLLSGLAAVYYGISAVIGAVGVDTTMGIGFILASIAGAYSVRSKY